MEPVTRLTRMITRQIADDLLVSVQNPIQLADNGAPQPDLAVVRDRHYGTAVPTAADVLFVSEVADTSLDYDRDTKLPLYAAAGIPESWLYAVAARVLEHHTDPGTNGYRTTVRAGRGESITSTVLPAVTIPVDAILGQPEGEERGARGAGR